MKDFNPLHHEGGDYSLIGFVNVISHFNPLHHEGGDNVVANTAEFLRISIHSTTRVETSRCIR